MAFKTFTAGEVLTAANVNDYLMEQAVIAATSATRPGSPNEGMMVFETDTDVVSFYMGAAWATGLTLAGWTDYAGSLSWTGSVTNPTIGNGTITAHYARWGRKVAYSFAILMGSTTTFGSGDWRVSLPISRNTTVRHSGSGVALDAGSATYYPLTLRASADVVQLVSPASLVTPTVPFTWANTDELIGSIVYEAAS